MLTKEDNELLTRVGPRTPMGHLLPARHGEQDQRLYDEPELYGVRSASVALPHEAELDCRNSGDPQGFHAPISRQRLTSTGSPEGASPL